MPRFAIGLILLLVVLTNLLPTIPESQERWTLSSDGQTISVSGRVKLPIWKKLNPVWWFLNEDDPDPPEWQLSGMPYIIRQLSWYVRNPLHNFSKYVLGVSDRNYTVIGTAPVYAATWSDVYPGKTGWKQSTIHLGKLRLPYISYDGEYVLWYAGWRWSGDFGFKFNIKNSPVQLW
jgi:hypothetical protein